MSRIGNKPVPVPAGVTVTVGDRIVVRGPKGQIERASVDGVSIIQEGGALKVNRASDSREHRASHGLVRALVNNMVVGVTKGFERKLEIQGVGYKAEQRGDAVVFQLGYSHPIEYRPPAGVTIAVDKSGVKVTIAGIDREAVGHVASVVRAFRSPDSYKGKGLRYEGERIRLKAGKTGGKSGGKSAKKK